jgi:hypothetical protein
MSDKSTSSRRAFLKGAAIAAAPVAAASAASAVSADERHARLARLEAEAQVRALHQDWLRKVNAGDPAEAKRLHETVSRVDADHAGAPDEIKLLASGLRAEARYACVVETAVERPRDCTLAQMAHAQGEGLIRTRERRVLKASYVKAEGGWAIQTLRLAPV